MSFQYGTICESGLAFFGKVSSTACHELKNVLAIISENNGLLEDMTFMAQKGRPIEPERLGRACAGVAKQIHRADEILKNISLFAHSVDQLEESIDLEDCCRLVVFLARRLTAAKKLTVEVEAENGAVRLAGGNLFLVENLIWTALLEAMHFCGNGGVMRLSVGKSSDGKAMIAFCGLDCLNEQLPPVSPLAELLASTPAQWEIRGVDQRCELVFTGCEG
jgi:C4-dicarboxylate-specific signal transduction histidine kinase